MQNELLEKLKRKMASAYQKGDIKSLAKYFNIQIDESRLEDYALVNANFDIPAAQFWDKKKDIIYVATFNSHVRWFNGNNNGIPYNYVVTINKAHREEAIYSIGEEKPFIDRLIFSKDDYDLVIQKKSNGDNEQETMVQYLMNVDYEGKKVQQELLTRIYGKYKDSDGLDYDFDQLFTYFSGVHRYVDYSDTEDVYFYNIKNKNIIYGINEYERSNSNYLHCDYMYGLCLEHGDVNVERFLPLNIRLEEFPSLSLNPEFACVFKFGIDGVHHKWAMYKIKDKFKITHFANRFNENCEHNYEVLDDSDVEFPENEILPLSETHMRAIMISLYGNDEFLKIVYQQLMKFNARRHIRDEKTKKEFYDDLSPRMLIDEPIEDIAQCVTENLDYFFDRADKKFRKHANIPLEEPVVKQLTPNK